MTVQITDRPDGVAMVLKPLAEKTVSQGYCVRSWTGITAEITDLHGPGRGPEDLRSKRPRLTAILEQVGGHAEMRLTPPCQARSRAEIGYGAANHLSFIPADMPFWQFAQRFRYIRRLIIDFDLPVLAACLGDEIEVTSRFAPRVMFRDSRILMLAELLADACLGTHADSRSYGDSLALAICYNLFRPGRKDEKRSGLAPAQLRRVTAFMEQSLPNAVALKDLAEMTGLCESYFSRAFKASTGMAPHRWYLAAKVQRSQKLLLETGDSLADVALASGFADQSHFTRAFRTIAGVSPGAWRRNHGI
ncbi:AraC family transcriptional regulator [Mesorhizobium sp. VK9D]|uniref:AraC family transcriptional regulator n=1 Tax=Mesorhizobium australafricanum TaxID=3072311 RepID=UPI002A24B4DE|nr:AraC family transcriptional regulator [Mesorhizobium sp. VK9D]MDX8453338.1 AraC family transcriptional regulator [Mesorhizobium sp. VK9D]